MAVEISKEEFEKKKALRREVEGKLNYLISARPTAVNMKQAADHLISYINSLDNDESVSAQEMQARYISNIKNTTFYLNLLYQIFTLKVCRSYRSNVRKRYIG